jgi:beta-glucosidase-like glycosyl hydrolase/CubicO group peptidase (beta-lactamase class C family)
MEGISLICMMVKNWMVALLCFLGIFPIENHAQSTIDFRNGFYHSAEGLAFAEKLTATLTFKQQLAQTLMVPAWSRETSIEETQDSSKFQKTLLYQIRDLGVGGIIFFQGNPLSELYKTNYYQQESSIPLLIGIDGEWGPAMRLTGMEKYPFQLTLGATRNRQIAYQMGLSMAAQCKRLGIHINFTPSVDVNTELSNPIIGFRSFGANAEEVSNISSGLTEGLQTGGVLASAKHFPGHGDTKTDSHLDLPVVLKSKSEIEQVDLPPFIKQIRQGVASVMVAHLRIPSIDTSKLPCSISPYFVKQWLRKDLGFQGLIITDALNMKGVAKMGSPADVALLALKAGNDIILFPEDVNGFLDSAIKARAKGEIDSAEIASRVIRIIATKYDLGLFDERFVNPSNLINDLEKIKSKFNNLYGQEIADESMIYCRHSNLECDVKNSPWKPTFLECGSRNDTLQLIVIGDSIPSRLPIHIQQFYIGTIQTTLLPWNADSTRIDSTLGKLANTQRLFVGLDWPTWKFKSRAIPQPWVYILAKGPIRKSNTLQKDQEFKYLGLSDYYIHFGHQYAVQPLLNVHNNCNIVIAHEYNPYSVNSALRMVFGKSHHYGTNNIGLTHLQENWNSSESHIIDDIDYAHGNIHGYDPDLHAVLDSMMREGIAREIFPSAQLVVLKDGQIAANINVGSVKDLQGNDIPTTQDHVYDVASITKIATTTLAFMRQFERSKTFNLDAPIGKSWPELAQQNKSLSAITFRELLTHQSGLPPFLPMQQKAIKLGAQSVGCQLHESNPTPPSLVAGENENRSAQFEISMGQCLDIRWADSAWKWILATQPSNDKSYVYSDINMILLAKWIEQKNPTLWQEMVNGDFYKSMGMSNTCFKPLDHGISPNRIAPTLIDSLWPRGEVRGIVHDPSAMMLGGVAGNAGLFSTAMDLAKLMYMLQEKGHSNKTGTFLLKPSTVDLFTKVHLGPTKKGYRGLGFDKPNGKEGNKANVFEGAPNSLFGHSGYTGTWAWSDPANGITFVFLSNRTYPTELNKKISQQGFRGDLLKAVYERLDLVK